MSQMMLLPMRTFRIHPLRPRPLLDLPIRSAVRQVVHDRLNPEAGLVGSSRPRRMRFDPPATVVRDAMEDEECERWDGLG